MDQARWVYTLLLFPLSCSREVHNHVIHSFRGPRRESARFVNMLRTWLVITAAGCSSVYAQPDAFPAPLVLLLLRLTFSCVAIPRDWKNPPKTTLVDGLGEPP
jgi:hypothetical protein